MGFYRTATSRKVLPTSSSNEGTINVSPASSIEPYSSCCTAQGDSRTAVEGPGGYRNPEDMRVNEDAEDHTHEGIWDKGERV